MGGRIARLNWRGLVGYAVVGVACAEAASGDLGRRPAGAVASVVLIAAVAHWVLRMNPRPARKHLVFGLSSLSYSAFPVLLGLRGLPATFENDLVLLCAAGLVSAGLMLVTGALMVRLLAYVAGIGLGALVARAGVVALLHHPAAPGEVAVAVALVLLGIATAAAVTGVVQGNRRLGGGAVFGAGLVVAVGGMLLTAGDTPLNALKFAAYALPLAGILLVLAANQRSPRLAMAGIQLVVLAVAGFVVDAGAASWLVAATGLLVLLLLVGLAVPGTRRPSSALPAASLITAAAVVMATGVDLIATGRPAAGAASFGFGLLTAGTATWLLLFQKPRRPAREVAA